MKNLKLITRHLRVEKGMALPLVLIVMVVLFILGSALLQYATTEAVQVSRSEKRMQAYYLARSGAEAIASDIITEEAASKIIEYFYSSVNGNVLVTQNIKLDENADDEFFKATITWHEVNEQIEIVSTGTVGDVTESITLYMNVGERENQNFFDNAIFAMTTISLTQGDVFGDVESGGDIIGEPTEGESYPNSKTVYESAVFPKINDLTHVFETYDLETKSNSPVTIDKAKYSNGVFLRNVDMNSKGDINFIIPQNETFVAMAESIMSKGNINVWHEDDVDSETGGTLLLFVNNNPQKSNDENELKVNSAGNLIIFLNDEVDIQIKTGSYTFTGYIYGPRANVYLQNPTIYGAIIAGKVSKIDNKNEHPFTGTVDFRNPPFEDSVKNIISEYADYPTIQVYEKYRWSN